MSSDVRIFVHAWWHTNGNLPWITTEIEERLVPYVGGVIRELGGVLVRAACSNDHIHLLVKLGGTNDIESLIQRVKGASSHWVGSNWPHLKGVIWQHGYGAWSLSEDAVDRVAAYIENQRNHHGS